MRRGSFLVCCCVIFLPLPLGLRAKRHSCGSFFSIHPCRIGLPYGKSKVTSCVLKATTVQFALQMSPTPMSVLVKSGMIYPVLGKSAANCGIVGVSFTADVATFPLAVPTLIIAELVYSGPCGAFGAI